MIALGESCNSSQSIAPSESISSTNTIPTVNLPIGDPPAPNDVRKAICWYFFHPPVDITVKKLKCYYCKQLVTYNKASSSNLSNHAKTHHKKMYNSFENHKLQASDAKQSVIDFKTAAKYDLNRSNELLVQWIISDSQAFRVAENPFFLAFVNSLHLDYKPIKSHTVASQV